MKLLISTIPDAPTDLADWLEEILVRGEMRQLAAELQTVHGQSTNESLDLESSFPAESVYRSGFSTLSPDNLYKLLARPKGLLKLTEGIYLQGGSYWNDRFKGVPGIAQRSGNALAKLRKAFLNDQSGPPLALLAPPVGRASWRRSPWFVGPLTAAVVLASVFSVPLIRRQLTTAGSVGPPLANNGPEVFVAGGWGWLKADAINQSKSPPDYLDHLADLVEEWNQKRPENANQLAQRITEWRLGCSRLLMNDHPSLEPQTEKWLMEKCRKWATAIDQNLTNLEAGENLEKVRSEVEISIKKTATTLRDEAKRLRQARG